jgi:hypothetical protein
MFIVIGGIHEVGGVPKYIVGDVALWVVNRH